MAMTQVKYLWIDGSEPTRKLRSKTKVMDISGRPPASALPGDAPEGVVSIKTFPMWGFDGSSTNQAAGADSDCLLQPVAFVPDPLLASGYLVLCEVLNGDGTPHETNTRHALANVVEQGGSEAESAWFGFEQEYTLFSGSKPLGFPNDIRHPPAQGPYYCGVGADEVYGRDLVTAHTQACMDAGLCITGTNAEVMPGQWEFQVGGPGATPLKACDHMWFARWLLYRIGEGYGLSATLDPKPVPGDWNGAGMHTNFSTDAMRSEGGMAVIETACEAIGEHRQEHLDVYGHGYKFRLTGDHETCSYEDFRYGVSDRTASIRIPRQVATDGHGYLEDRRPNANADPYEVAAAMIKSTCGLW
jgi:glutamine synthetase